MALLRILTWHVHGTHLWAMAQMRHEIYLPTKPGRPPGYGGRSGAWPWPDNVHEVPVDELADLVVDAVIYQTHEQWLVDRRELLSDAQRAVPQIVLEHDPPHETPTDTRHPVDDPDVVVVHLTSFNQLMWDTGRTPTRVIEPGVAVPEGVRYEGRQSRGIVAIDGLARWGRRLGADIFAWAREQVPLDLVGAGSEELGGFGEVPPPDLCRFMAPYRFYFHPVRYGCSPGAGCGLSLCQAMAVGLPVVALATAEAAALIHDGVDGFVDTDLRRLVGAMQRLVDDPELARQVGEAGRALARERFGILRLVQDWEALLAELCPPSTDQIP